MKKTLTIGLFVIAAHCVAISGLFLMQGCKSTRGVKPVEPAAVTPVMPPRTAPAPETGAALPPVDTGLAPESSMEYTVAKGDSLGVIAKRHGVSRAELAAANKISDPNKIRVGQKLIIPRGGHAAVHTAKAAESKPKEKKAEKKAATTTLATGINEYVVESGDSLSKIAAKFKVKVSELREVNSLVSDKIKVGQKLLLPGAKKAEAAPAPAAAAPAPEAAAAAPAAAVVPAAAPAAAPEAAPAKAAEPAADAKPVGSGISHTVVANDDVASVAKLYFVSESDLAAINNLGTNRTLKVGQKLVIP